MTMTFRNRVFACLLSAVTLATGQPGGLRIQIVEGEGAVNNIQQRVAREPVVQVTDEQDRPVEGAVVIFTLPRNGASGVFADGSQLLTATTDSRGRAVARGFRPNRSTGEFEVSVTASYQGRNVSRRFKMTNVATAAAGVSASKVALILALVGGAVAGGVVAASGGKTTTAPPGNNPPSVSLTPGAGTVGPPQ
ncbi:MAG: hypothetical protein ACKV22_12875 [Bryobacteraceae bacterium]